jgi:nitric oxide reductase NorQ protein
MSDLLLEAPFYLPTGDEVELFRAAYEERIPVLLKGPTGCGKTRFVEYMAWTLTHELVTVTCHDDMTAADLVGRYLLAADGTTWLDGPLTRRSDPGRCATWTRWWRPGRTPRSSCIR